MNSFSLPVLAWFDKFGRKNLPWQHPRDPYRVWISEIMLQQTQVKTVIPYFERFMTSFPTIHHVANASEDQVLAHWSGLGYYSRARNIYKTATIICTQYAGCFPQDLAHLVALPGIGASTAAAIASQAFNQPTAILDGNVKRVLSRYFKVDGWPGHSKVSKQLWQLAEECMPQTRCADYTQAIMDLGATCCTRNKPSCAVCPVHLTCQSFLNNVVNDYPQKKQKKVLPVKQQIFLLFYNEKNEIFLEKRPPTGIWGGLWCLPALELTTDLNEYISQSFNFKIEKITELMKIKHTFSHFHLEINAKAIGVTALPNQSQVKENTGWFYSPNNLTLGLAKPVSQLINRFLECI